MAEERPVRVIRGDAAGEQLATQEGGGALARSWAPDIAGRPGRVVDVAERAQPPHGVIHVVRRELLGERGTQLELSARAARDQLQGAAHGERAMLHGGGAPGGGRRHSH